MTPGSIFFDQDFHFHDGETGKKLFVVLGSGEGVIVVAKTTSKQHGRGCVCGCQPDDRFPNFHLPLHSCYLKKPTWVCLDGYYEFDLNTLFQKRLACTLHAICDLEAQLTKDLQICAVDSEDISEDQEDIVRSCIS